MSEPLFDLHDPTEDLRQALHNEDRRTHEKLELMGQPGHGLTLHEINANRAAKPHHDPPAALWHYGAHVSGDALARYRAEMSAA